MPVPPGNHHHQSADKMYRSTNVVGVHLLDLLDKVIRALNKRGQQFQVSLKRKVFLIDH